MGGIERRELMKAAAIGGIALSMGGAQCLLPSNETHAQGAPPRAAAWSNRRLLDVLKIEHPIIQAPMGAHISPDMPVAVFLQFSRDLLPQNKRNRGHSDSPSAHDPSMGLPPHSDSC
jgi:hypothetical protein